jgi:hypothetical protein
MMIDWRAPGVRRWIWIATGAVVLVIAWISISPRGGPTPLPSGVAREVEQHAEASAIDTMEIHRLERVVDSAAVKEQAAVTAAHRSEAGIARAPARQDSASRSPAAAAVVATVRLPSDISIDDLQAVTIASAHKDTALAWARVEVASLDTALARSEERAARADTVIGAVEKVAESREARCRVLLVVPCPSRMLVMAGTAVLTLVAVGRR